MLAFRFSKTAGGQGVAAGNAGDICHCAAATVGIESDDILGRRGFGYRNRQLLRIAARAVGSLDGEGGGSRCGRRAADLAGVLVQAQTGRPVAVFNAPCDGRSAVGAQGLAVSLAHLAVRQGVRGDGNGIDAGLKLCRQLGYICRNAAARCVELAVAAKPHKVAAGISVRPDQTVGGRRGKALTVFYDNLDGLRAVTQLAAAKVEGNGFQPVSAQGFRVQDLKDRTETDARAGPRSIPVAPVAGGIVPATRTVHQQRTISILPPRMYLTTVFDISIVLVQYPVPFVALGRAASGIARACTITSRGRRTQRIAYAAGGVIFAKNQTCVIQVIPSYCMCHDIIRHKQAVCIFVLLCILLCGCHRCCKLVCVHCPGVGKGNIVQGIIRQSIVHRAGNTHCR